MLFFDDNGASREIAVERMDTYLVEDESYPEIFELYVGCDEAYERPGARRSPDIRASG